MKSTRRLAVASLLVIAVAIVLGAPAPASAGYNSTKLYPAANSPNPKATGTVTLYASGREAAFADSVIVSVSKLAPNALYHMPVTVLDRRWGTSRVLSVFIQTDARGNGGGGFSAPGVYYIINQPGPFNVYDASGTLVLTSHR